MPLPLNVAYIVVTFLNDVAVAPRTKHCALMDRDPGPRVFEMARTSPGRPSLMCCRLSGV